MTSKQARYSSLSDDDTDSSSPFIEKESTILEKRRKYAIAVLFWTAQLLFFLFSIGILYTAHSSRQGDVSCGKQLSTYSPLFDEGVIEYEDVEFNGEFFHFPQTVYRGPPTLEREEAWESLTFFSLIDIPDDKLPLLGKSYDHQWIRTKPEFGGGFAAEIEAFHQLHCVNFLRQYIYRDHYNNDTGLPMPSPFSDPPEVVVMHVDHCLEIMRINIMCTGDATPVLFEHDPTLPMGYRIDFSTKHTCRNFGKMAEWRANNIAYTTEF
ncbi:hypothetical protein N431DRAFT_475379 [Stipitochalara longipes BDJ]|nr:hypothetical protein N431DRAFT_475379 [Stipitochalara longipes BDJ]